MTGETQGIWYMLTDHEKYLYHYTSASTFINHIFPDQTFRISRFEFVNDPWESKNWDFQWNTEKREFSGEPERFAPLLDHALKTNWCVGCFTADPPEALMTHERENRGDDILAAPYERGHSRPTMWAHYADKHSGVCIVLSRPKLIRAFEEFCDSKNREFFHAPVDYDIFTLRRILGRDGPFSINIDLLERLGADAFVKQHLHRHWRKIFFRKNKDWAHEHEYRVLVEGGKSDALFVPIGGTILGVALGNKCSDEHRSTIGKLLLDKDVLVCTMNWRMGAPQLGPTHPRLLTRTEG